MIKSWSFDSATLWLYAEPAAPLAWESCVSADELARAHTMGSAARVHTFLSSRAFLRRHLREHLGMPAPAITIAIQPDGKPYVPDAQWHFSLSHSAGRILIGIAPCSIGIDLQRQDDAVDIEAIAERMFDDDQKAAVKNASDRRHTAYAIWCEKEALFKLGQAPRLSTTAELDEGFMHAICIA